MKLFLISFLMLSWLFRLGLAQQQDTVVFERLTIKDGLSHNNIRAIMQDRKGFLWFGSYGGIDRYDGHSFKSFKYEHGNPHSLSNNHVTSLWEDHEGMIWAATSSNGLCKLDPHTEKITRYLENRDLPNGLQSPTVTRVMEDSQNRLWVGTMEGLQLFNRNTGEFYHFISIVDDPSTISSNSYILSLFEDREGTVWVGTFGGGLNRVNMPKDPDKPEEITFTRYHHDPKDSSSLSNDFVNSVFEDSQGDLWVGTNYGLNKFHDRTQQFNSYFHDPLDANSLNANKVSSIAEDHHGNLWISTPKGLNKLDSSRTRFKAYPYDPANPGSPSGNQIGAPLLVDRSGILWTGSEDAGVNKYDPHLRHLKFLQHEPGNPNSLSNNEVKAIYEDRRGIIWIGTGEGLNAYDPSIDIYTRYRYDPEDPTGISNDHVQSICEDMDGNIWIGTGAGIGSTRGICMLERKTGKFISFYPYEEKPLLEIIFSIIEDRTGLIWLATSNGIKSYHRQKDKWTHYPFDPNNPAGISGPWARAIIEDRQGNIWVGTGSGGLNKLDRKTGNFSHYLNDPKTAFTEIHSLREDSNGKIWVGTDGGGLYFFDPVTEKYEVFSEKDGLIDNAIHNILEDDLGNLWLNTNKGLCRFSPSDRTFTGFDFAEGTEGGHFVSGNLNMGACFKGRDGKLYFGGKHGFTFFHPQDLRFNTRVPPITISQVRLFDKPLLKSHKKEKLVFDHHQNFISFEFAALNFTNSHKNQYAYRLQNFDKDWVFAGERRYASYTNLGPGTYTFQVRGSNNDGIWNQKGEILTFVIRPPWWGTWWAYIGYFLLFLTGLLLARRETLRRERLRAGMRIQQVEADKLREIDSLKSQFFSNISHEFRTPLALIQGSVQKLTGKDRYKSNPDYELIYRSANRLLQLVDQLLDLSRLEAGKLRLNPVPGDIMHFLAFLTGSFSSLFENKGIRYKVSLSHESLWVLFDEDKLEKIVSNLLSNACKFTPSGSEVVLEIRVKKISFLKTELQIKIEDQGIGIPTDLKSRIFDRFFQVDPGTVRSYEGAGIGLSLTKELVELHGGTISVESIQGQGTTFFITIPFSTIPSPDAKSQSNGKWKLQNMPLVSRIPGEEPSSNGESHQQKPEKKAGPTILVVEDNVDLRHFIVTMLTNDYKVYEAGNGILGWEKALEIIPDLIISDVMMPEMDGICLCGKLKSDERTSHISIILLTAKADKANKLEGLNCGADDYLTKPFDVEELRLRVQNQLNHKRLLRERYARQITFQPKAVEGMSLDEKFLQKIGSIMEAHMDDPTFGVEVFCKEIGMSRVHFYRKLKMLTDQSPGELIRNLRLKKASMLLAQKQGNISEVAFAVGFSSISYFTKSFHWKYGQTPSDFIAALRK